jgi:hypothetical protein
VGDTVLDFFISEQMQNKMSSSKSIAVGLTRYSNRGLSMSSIVGKYDLTKYSCSAINLIVFQHLLILMFDLDDPFLDSPFLDLIFSVLPFLGELFISFSILYVKEFKNS